MYTITQLRSGWWEVTYPGRQVASGRYHSIERALSAVDMHKEERLDRMDLYASYNGRGL